LIEPFKGGLTDAMLFGVVSMAKAQTPSIRRLQPDAPVSFSPDMGAFYVAFRAIWNGAMMPSDPGTVS
jgi:hypothetical protein